MANLLIDLGRFSEALDWLQRAVRLNPLHPAWYLYAIGEAHYGARQYEQAVEPLFSAINRFPTFITPRRHLAATYAQLGRMEEAKAEIVEILRLDPLVSLTRAAAAVARVRIFAHPAMKSARAAGGLEQLIESGARVPGYTTLRARSVGALTRDARRAPTGPLRIGSSVGAGTVLGRVGRARRGNLGRIRFEIRPAGHNATRIDPGPILDAWRHLAAAGAFRPSGAAILDGVSVDLSFPYGLRAPLGLLQRRVLSDPRITVYPCGRADIAMGRVDRRVLLTLEFLAASNLRPTVTSLACGHSYYTASGNVSEHSFGNAVDIAAVNGIAILGHQGTNSIADVTIRRLLTLSGSMKPHQIISLMTFDGADNTLSLSDHDDHIHVGFRPRGDAGAPLRGPLAPALSPRDWRRLSTQLAAIRSPAVPVPPRLRGVPSARARSRA